MNNTTSPIKLFIVILALAISIFIAYALPRVQYKGSGFISNLKIPDTIADWKGKDISENLNLDFDKNWNRFISGVFIHEYKNSAGQRLVLIILDAGNFHHPNVCFTAAGYEIKELKDTEFNISDRSIEAHTLYTTKEQENNLSFYWIIIDKKLAANWLEQKIKQLYFSLFNRERVGLMVRIDIPAREGKIEEKILQARQFLNNLNKSLPPEQADYLFGER